MLDFIANKADFIIAAVSVMMTADMLPTIWHQFRAKASTVPLTSSVPTSIGLGILGLVFFATGLYLATGTMLIGSMMWIAVSFQRIWYNRRGNGKGTKASDTDPDTCPDNSGVRSSVPVRYGPREDGHSCLHFSIAGWCGHGFSAGKRSSGKETDLGLEGASKSTPKTEQGISNLIYRSFASTSDINADSFLLEKRTNESSKEQQKRIKCRSIQCSHRR